METWMKILQRPVPTLKDSQRLGCWDTLGVYLSDRERRVIRKQNKIPLATVNDPDDWQWVSLVPKVAI